MSNKEYILIDVIFEQYPIEKTVIHEVFSRGLVKKEVIKENVYVHENELTRLEKILRLNQDLEINMAGIEVVLDLLKKIEDLENELSSTKRRLTIWQK